MKTKESYSKSNKMAQLISGCIIKSILIILHLKPSILKMYIKTGNHLLINLYKILYKKLTLHMESMT